MIVFDLKCEGAGHVFEAWFAGSSAYEDQKAKGLLMCPVCGSTDVGKAIMAPNVSAKGNRQLPVQMTKPEQTSNAETAKAALAVLAKAQAAALENSLWVGRDFEKQARAMDAGEVDHSSIHGEVSPAEAKALIDDGIGVMPLLLPVVPPNQRN